MCYCEHRTHSEILQDIQQRAIPVDALKQLCCWDRICAVRDSSYHTIDTTTWLDLWDEACRVRHLLFTP